MVPARDDGLVGWEQASGPVAVFEEVAVVRLEAVAVRPEGVLVAKGGFGVVGVGDAVVDL